MPNGAYEPIPPEYEVKGQQIVYPFQRQAQVGQEEIQRRLRGELTGDEYLYWQRAVDLVAGWIQSGRWTPEQGEAALERVDQHLIDMGVSPNTYLYEQVWAPIKTEREYQEKIEKKEGLIGLQRVQRDRVLGARDEYNRMAQYLLDAPMSPEEKRNSLLNLYYQYAEEAMLPETTPQDLEGAIVETLTPAERQKRMWGPPVQTRKRPVVEPFRPEPAFEEMRGGLQPQPWREWFESSYSQILRQYKATEEEPTTKGWAEYLKRRKPELKEEWWTGRRERAAFAPRITTVKF